MKIGPKVFNVFCALLCVCFLCACKKSILIAISNSNILYRDSVIRLTEVKVYTNKSEITNASVKARFTKPSLAYFNLDTKPFEANYSITFLKPDTIKINPGGIYAAKITGTQYLLTPKDSIQTGRAIPLYLNIFKYNAPYVPFRFGSQTLYSTRVLGVAYGNTTEMTIPIICYRLTSRPSTAYYVYTGIANNDFDSSIIKNLGPKDTLAVQLFNYRVRARY